MTLAEVLVNCLPREKAFSLSAEDACSNPNRLSKTGRFADGSSWSKVIPLLQEMGYHAVGAESDEPSQRVE
ncbi:MAG TPA: hypothetical protein VEU94_01825 [Terriglobales bacterium]|nr:hypothetical protein [Terriglobales bacterium]